MSQDTIPPYDQHESPFLRPMRRVRRIFRPRPREHRLNYGIYKFFRGIHRLYRDLRSSPRHRRLRREISYTERTRNPWRFLTRLFRDESQRFILLGIIFASIIFSPFVAPIAPNTPVLNTILNLLTAFVAIAGLLTTFYIVISLFSLRERYIVVPFDVGRNTELAGVAELLKYNFIVEIKRISRLLSLRQVDNVGVDSSLAFFTTSGQQQNLTEDLQSLAILNTNGSNTTTFFAGLVATVLRLLAMARITGLVEKEPSGGLHIRIDFAKRNRDTISVDIFEAGVSEKELLDETTLQQLARRLALKLVYQLGHGSHLASSLDSLHHFLVGLQAATERNWWRAADAYQSNIAIEEDHRGQFGIGHYHLGVTLISQGNIDEGVKHLERAQMSGPPLAETYYMLALIKLSDNYSELHRRRIEVKNIDKLCEVALSIRPDFPEVYHLLGTTYYQRGKLVERAKTRKIERADQDELPKLNETEDYRRAEYYFRRAKDLYRRAIRRIRAQFRLDSDIQTDLERLTKERLMAIHRLGDVMRSLQRYHQANSYYRDVLAVLPNNVRTLIDLSKTYCLANEWKVADEFLSRRVRRVPEAQWHTDANFYVAWMFLGGVSQRNRADKQENHNLLGRAISHLDYALYMRPQYIDRWQQTDWKTPFEAAFERISNWCPQLLLRTDELPHIAIKAPLHNAQNHAIYRRHLRLWIDWRCYSLYEKVTGFDDNSSHEQKRKEHLDAYKDIQTILNMSAIKDMHTLFEEVRDYRRQFAILLEKFQETGRSRGMHHIRLAIAVGHALGKKWKQANKVFEKFPLKKHDSISFIERLAVDMLCQIAILGAKSMVEARLFAKAIELLNKTLDQLEEWIKRWEGIYQKNDHFFLFSPRVMRFQLTTLHSWLAYCLVVSKDDEEVFRHSTPEERKIFDSIHKRHATYCLQKALRYMPLHPLMLYTRAWMFKANGQHENAIETLSRLEAILQPFDHNNHIANWRILNKTPEYDVRSHDPDYEFEKFKEKPTRNRKLRTQLARQELVSGQEQFRLLVNPTRVHLQLAENYTLMGRNELAVSHLMKAVILSEHNDIDADALLEIIQQLDYINRFGDARAVIKTLRTQRFLLDDMTLSAVKHYIPRVLECVLLTRVEHYAESLQKGKMLYADLLLLEQRWKGEATPDGNSLSDFYKARLESTKLTKIFVPEDKSINIWSEDYAEDIKKIIDATYTAIITDNPSDALKTCYTAWSNSEKFLELYARIAIADEKLDLLKKMVLYFFCWDATRLVETMSTLRNNLAYNALELQIHSEDIVKEEKATHLVERAINDLKELHKLFDAEPAYHHLRRVNRLLAFSIDTRAWLKLRRVIHIFEGESTSEEEKDVRELLNEAQTDLVHAISLHQNAAIFYYHLARVELALLEHHWQTVDKADISKTMSIISGLLIRMYQNWEKAYNLDTHKRLSGSLAWLGRRIEEYRNAWHKRTRESLER